MGDQTTRIHDEIESLRQMTTGQLQAKYREAFGEETRSNHKQFLFRRIAWRIHANAWGGLSERARRHDVPKDRQDSMAGLAVLHSRGG